MPKITKVLDPQKKVTDPVVLKELARQGIDKDYVEFSQDYAPRSLGKGHSPYAKFYRDLKSGRKFIVVSGLPMVKPSGQKIQAGWVPPIATPAGKFRSKPNLFLAEVNGKKIALTCLHDQPDGKKEGDKVTYNPQLFLNGMEQSCEKATLLDTDPINENYHQNVLEWDYGICKRRLRIVEGRIHGYWIFSANPNGGVRIKYNQTGQYRLKLCEYAVGDDEEIIPQSAFDEAIYPFKLGDSATYYPDAHVENSSVDGQVYHYAEDAGWAAVRGGAGSAADDDDTDDYIGSLYYYFDWTQIIRGIFLFDSSGLPDTAVISAAILTLYGQSKKDDLGVGSDINIYSSDPASSTALVPGDYDSLGTTPFCDTAIAYADLNIGTPGDPNTFAFNDAGLAAISKIGVSKFGAREATHDAGNSEPTNSFNDDMFYFGSWLAEKGNGYKPKLVVTYSTPTDYERSLSTAIGLSATLSRVKGFPRSLSASIGLSATLSSFKEILRSQTTSIGLSATLGRSKGYTRSLTTAIGLSSSLLSIYGWVRSLTTGIGLSSSLATQKNLLRTQTASIGLSSSLSAAKELFRSLKATIGLSVSLSAQKGLLRALATSMGLSSTLSAQKDLLRTLSTTIGLSVSLTRIHGWVRSLTTSIGLYSWLRWTTKMKRRIASIGTNRTVGDVGTNREISTTGENRDREAF